MNVVLNFSGFPFLSYYDCAQLDRKLPTHFTGNFVANLNKMDPSTAAEAVC